MLMEINPNLFNAIAVGVGSMFVGLGSLLGLVIHVIADRKTNNQHLAIAVAQEQALRSNTLSTEMLQGTANNIQFTINGRMDELLRLTRAVALAEGIAIGQLSPKSDPA